MFYKTKGYTGSVEIYFFPEDEQRQYLKDFQEFADENGEVTLQFGYYASPYVPAQITGPVERCHPAEGGEIEDVWLEGVIMGNKGLTNDFISAREKRLINHFYDEIEQKAIDDAAENQE